MKDYIFTSESVTLGHPDKICDFIADSILDEALKQDRYSKMAVEVTIKNEIVFIYGEATTLARLDYEHIARQCLRKIGYKENYHIILKISEQSQEIHEAVSKDHEVCAGDQGIMFGYACNETEAYMPAPIYYAHRLAFALNQAQKKHAFLGPDGKTQVSVEYKDGKVARIDTIVVSTQHKASAKQDQIRKVVMQEVIRPTIPDDLLDKETKYYINPSGSFVVGGSLVILVQQAERSFVILMEEWEELEVDVYLLKIQVKLIEVVLIMPDMLRKILLLMDWLIAAKSRSLMRLDKLNLFP